MVSELLHLACVFFSFSLNLGKPNCTPVPLFLCKDNSLYFWGITIYFLLCEFEYLLSLSSVWAGWYPQGAYCVFREKEAMSWAGLSAWSLASQWKERPARRWHRQLLVAGRGKWQWVLGRSTRWSEYLAIAATQWVSSQGCESNNSLCLIAMAYYEVIRTTGGACIVTPSGSSPWLSL